MNNEKHNSLTVLNLNIASIRKHFDSLLTQLHTLAKLPNVIVLTEIWIFPSEIPFYNIEGYKGYFLCNDTYRSGGVAVFVQENIGSYVFETNCLSNADYL